MKRKLIQSLMAEIDKQRISLHGLAVMHEGELMTEMYFRTDERERPHRMYSVSKSIVSLAVGILESRGLVRLEQTGAEFFPEWIDETTPPEAKATTIRDMLRMTTCHNHRAHWETDANWAIQYYKRPAERWPGGSFGYDSTGTQVLTALCRKLTGLDMLEFLQGELFDRIGAMDRKFWMKDLSGVETGGTGLYLTVRDLARIANYCMSDGSGIVSKAYLREATSFQTDTSMKTGDQRYGYGYQFWMLREGYAMIGMAGQLALMLPRKRLSLCTTADTSGYPGAEQKIIDAFFHFAEML